MKLWMRLALGMTALVAVTAATVWVSTALEFQHALEPRELEQLGHHAQALARELEANIADAPRDALTLAGAVEPDAWSDRDELAQASRDRLATLFESLLAAKPHYLQARLLDASGREIVRVQRRAPGDALHRVPPLALQDKGERSYFREGMAREPREVYLSPLNLNREHGRVETPHVATLRAVTPVTSDGRVRGLIAINVGLAEALARLESHPHSELRVVNSEGDFLVHPNPAWRYASDVGHGHRLSEELPELAQTWPGLRHGRVLANDGRDQVAATAVVRLSPGRDLLVVETTKRSVALAALGSVRRASLIAGGLSTLLAIALALLLARYVSGPLSRMARSVKRFPARKWVPVPPAGDPEMQILALALNEMASDVTHKESELRESRAEVVARASALEQSNEALEQYAHAASHDLREPLRAICQATQLLETRYADALGQEGQTLARMASGNARRMSRLVHDLLEYARLDVNAPQARLVDLRATVTAVLADRTPMLEESRAEVICDELPSVRGHESLLLQVFQNLIDNSLKFRGSTATRVRIGAQRSGDEWIVSVADNGIGIEPVHRDHVFDMFNRLHPRDRFDGNGIGLALVKKAVLLHGGRVWCEETPGGGCTVRFTLPARDDPESMPREAPERHGAARDISLA